MLLAYSKYILYIKECLNIEFFMKLQFEFGGEFMNYKVAFVSNDGKNVNENFETSRKLFIFEIKENIAEYLETRESDLCFEERGHNEKHMKTLLNLISDCKAIFVKNIGYMALVFLKFNGIKAFETDYSISDVIEGILSSSFEI
ncbi:Dinitrogenase iron-molybdenum cofactor biosynthesis protein [Clostridium carboxidivorans P7]|uniref:Dinitrogenase iron-molybdenum cofactor biosynthesis protein n=2 Tax=Clostridium TaxID=1485 RepID=C6PTL5_9CLOT|nr:Dinitrogenase iron-molybdenum cofactor biosynthesis protein [Clostridium carboxidivorans P7]